MKASRTPKRIKFHPVRLGLILITAACTPFHGTTAALTTPTFTESAITQQPSAAVIQPTGTEPAALPDPTPTKEFLISSPLAEISTGELEEILTTPFDPPAPGLDDGHHGVDFSFYSRGSRKNILGLPVQSVFSGVVAAQITDRPPYGNMVMIETRLADLPVNWITELGLDQTPPLPPLNARLQCPDVDNIGHPDSNEQSLYLLYAHMEKPSTLTIGDPVASGQIIGAVGNTGMSGNPHLHLEARVGPSFATFSQMAHYINSASPEEMSSYCAWRISGRFWMIDPLLIFRTPTIR